VIFWPKTPSEISGKVVPQRMANIDPTNTRLFARNAASRERKLSTSDSGCSRSRRHQTRAVQTSVITLRKPRKM
jgi:hypothetical protein